SLSDFCAKALVKSLLQAFPQSADYWATQPIRIWTISGIIRYFEEKIGTRIFVHFDEIDNIIWYPTPTDNTPLAKARQYYEFWNLIHPILLSGNLLYITGRSSYLYALGQGWYQIEDSHSPCSVQCILLNVL